MGLELFFQGNVLIEQSEFVEYDPVGIAAEPDRTRIAAGNGHFSPVRRVLRASQQFEYDDAAFAMRHTDDGLVGDGNNLGLALVVSDRQARMTLDAGKTLLRF